MTRSFNQKPSIPPTSVSKSRGKGLLVLSLIFRLLLVGVGSGFAWVLGMAIAQIYPSRATEMPLAERLLRLTQNLTPSPERTPAKQIPALPGPTVTPSPQSKVSPAQREKLQSDLRQLQGQINALIGRTAALESQLGIRRPTATLGKRSRAVVAHGGVGKAVGHQSPDGNFGKAVAVDVAGIGGAGNGDKSCSCFARDRQQPESEP